VGDPPRLPRDTPLSAKASTKFCRQVAVDESVWLACELRATEFVLFVLFCDGGANITIIITDIIDRPVFRALRFGVVFCLRLQVEHTHLNLIELVSLPRLSSFDLKTETEFNIRNVVFYYTAEQLHTHAAEETNSRRAVF
jgi:hypothetical protein